VSYRAAWWLKNGHVQSIYPSLFRRLDDRFLVKERIDTPDQDFIDLDWGQAGNRRLVVLTHGLEGHSRRPYMLGMASTFLQHHWDVMAWNFRSCSGETNRHLRSYHSGAIDDLDTVVRHAISKGYDEVALIGFSIGGNKTLIYLGKNAQRVPKQVIGAVVFSVPCDLRSSSEQLAKPKNILYMRNFLASLKQKLKQKQLLFPNEIDLRGYAKIRNFREYDDRYTAPFNGFKDAEDYWRQSSSKQYLEEIVVPTLMISAKDDPFLTPECFPYEVLAQAPSLTFEATDNGGHVGFMRVSQGKRYWSEQRALAYLQSLSQL